MTRAARYLIPSLVLLGVAALLGWLIFAKVFAGYTDLGGYAGEHFERGWPIKFEVRSERPASGRDPGDSIEFYFSGWALAANLAIALAVLLVVALWLWRRLRLARPWQFSLRAALIVVALIAGASGWLTREVHLWQRERLALEALPHWSMREVYGGPQWLRRFHSRETLTVFHHVVSASTPGLRRTEDGLVGLSDSDLQSLTAVLPSLPWLRAVDVTDFIPATYDEFHQWTTIERLDLPSIFATDDVLRRVARMPRLKWLDLYGNEGFTHSGLAELARSKSLEVLILDSTKVTDRGIAALARLPHLRDLSLNGTAVTDHSIESFCQMRSLERLSAYETQISDSGARRLIGLPRLKELWLPFNHVSEETAEFLGTKIAWVQRY
jgi:hypothetical protein